MLENGWRIDVANKIVQIINDNPTTPINILAHSLGTGVLHGTLSKCMRKSAPDGVPFLNPDVIKFNSLWMFANVVACWLIILIKLTHIIVLLNLVTMVVQNYFSIFVISSIHLLDP